MSKLNEMLDDAFVNAPGLKKQPKKEKKSNKAPEPIVDDLEDIDDTAPEAEEEEAPEPEAPEIPEPEPEVIETPELEPEETEPEEPEEPEPEPQADLAAKAEEAKQILAPKPKAEPKSLDPRLLEIFREALISDKDLRAAAREILEAYPDKPTFVWVYQMDRGPKKGQHFIGKEAAIAAIPKTAREYVKLDEAFIRTLCKLNEDGTPGEEATREEYEEYVAEMATADQSTADSTESGTSTVD